MRVDEEEVEDTNKFHFGSINGFGKKKTKKQKTFILL